MVAIFAVRMYFNNQICKYDIEKSIEREMSGDLKTGMVTIGMMTLMLYYYYLEYNFSCCYSEMCPQ